MSMATDGDAMSVTEGALSIASAVASALPPPWDVTGVAADVLGDVLDFFFGGTTAPQGPTLQQIVDALDQQSTIAAITSANDAITSSSQIFLSATSNDTLPLPASVNQALTSDPDGTFSTLYNFLHNTVTGTTPGALIDPITSMATADATGDIFTAGTNEQAAYLPTFAYGVSTYLLLTTYWVSLTYSVNKTVDRGEVSLQEVIAQLSTTPVHGQPGWIGYAEWACAQFTTRVEARLAQVSPETQYSFWDHMLPPTTLYASYIADTGAPVQGFDPTGLPAQFGLPSWPGTQGGVTLVSEMPAHAVYAADAGDNDQAVYDTVAKLRDAYVERMRQALYDNYFDAGVMSRTIADWKTALARLQAL